ncbi:MAG: hypothetical protein AAFX79_02705 [Planctomycetota bacterium]
MTTMDLIELAVLDALDMLDDAEREAFERAFRSAVPATQARVRAEQARLANLDALLPDVEPDPALRGRVIDAVRQAVLASTVASYSESDQDAEPTLRLRSSDGVSRTWRVGAIASAAAAILFGVAFGSMWQRYNELDQRIQDNALVGIAIESFGAEATEIFLDRESYNVAALSASDDSENPGLALWYHREQDLGFLFCPELPANSNASYELVVLDDDGEIDESLFAFTASGSYTIERIEGVEFPAGRTLAVASVDRVTGEQSILFRTDGVLA